MTQNDTNNRICPHCRCSHAPHLACAAAGGGLLAQAELLFESYLAARLVRARRNLTAAKVALLRDPRSRERRDALLRAESETQRLHTQLLDQARRAAALRERTENTSPAAAADPAPQPHAPVSSQATADFRTLQAAKAEITLVTKTPVRGAGALPDNRQCPRCGNGAPGDAATCACGHRFTGAGAFLTAEEIAALTGTKSTE